MLQIKSYMLLPCLMCTMYVCIHLCIHMCILYYIYTCGYRVICIYICMYYSNTQYKQGRILYIL